MLLKLANPYNSDVKRDIINQRLNFDWKNVQFSPVLKADADNYTLIFKKL